jgi:transcriptional regulator with XRE-family HTH domain
LWPREKIVDLTRTEDYISPHVTGFGAHIRALRKKAGLSGRQVAEQAGLDQSYLSRLERGKEGIYAPSEEKVQALARALGEDPDVLLAMTGRVSQELLGVILSRPAVFAQLIRQLKDAPENAILRVVREVRDGDW